MTQLAPPDTGTGAFLDRPPPPAAARSLGVLVVDDDGGVRGVVAAGLKCHGLAVWQAADGGEAAALYRRHRGAIDMTLLDVRMPGRDGPATLAELLRIDPRIRVCFMSGDTGGYTDHNLTDLGALAVFPKPLCLSELAARLVGLMTPSDLTAAWSEAAGRTVTGAHRV